MSKKTLGDFQTPPALVEQVLAALDRMGVHWTRALEPTCGCGSFIQGLLKRGRRPAEIVGIELLDRHLKEARAIRPPGDVCVDLQKANVFDLHLGVDIRWKAGGPLLVIGNPPWVTNSELSALRSSNVPRKSNFKGLRGIDAITGSSNFDIAEFIWIKLLGELAGQDATVSLLCKTSVARNVLRFARGRDLPIAGASMHRIDARRWFGAAADACLFTVRLTRSSPCYEAHVFDSLSARSPCSKLGFVGEFLVPDMETYRALSFVEGGSPIEWRQGIKHDAAPVMELVLQDGTLRNRLGEVVHVESEHLYPLVKSSDLQAADAACLPKRRVILPQCAIGQDTTHLKTTAPALWGYLMDHADVFMSRKSSIYRGKPPFSIFGVGEYSFAEYKVLISGFYKHPRFVATGPRDGKPVICDDTCYLLPLRSALQAAVVAALLNHLLTRRFIESIVFWDAKRPITKTLLRRINLGALARRTPAKDIRKSAENILRVLSGGGRPKKMPPPSEVVASLTRGEPVAQTRLFED